MKKLLIIGALVVTASMGAMATEDKWIGFGSVEILDITLGKKAGYTASFAGGGSMLHCRINSVREVMDILTLMKSPQVRAGSIKQKAQDLKNNTQICTITAHLRD